MKSDKEIWKDIKDYEGLYQVSNLGRVKSLERKVKNNNGYRKIREKILKNTKRKDGYLVVVLWKDNIDKMFLVHRLVAQAFIPNLENKPQVNHINENPSNNEQSNLEWCDAEYNNRYGKHIERGLITQGTKVNQYDLEGNFIKTYDSINQAERELGISHGSISKCCKKLQSVVGGYIWKYL